MKSEIREYKINNRIERVQAVFLDSWDSLNFYEPVPSAESFDRVCNLYEDFIVPAAPFVFGTLKFTSLFDGRKRTVRSKNPLYTKKLPVRPMGFLSTEKEGYTLLVNSNFFVMDMFDVGTKYDEIGTPIGLCIKDGKVLNPPLFNREALIVKKDGSITVEPFRLSVLGISINGQKLSGEIFERPKLRKTPIGKGIDIFIIGCKVVDIMSAGRHEIPSSGFVFRVSDADFSTISIGDEIIYTGAEDILFALQVGNSILVDGKRSEKFISYFSNVKDFKSCNIPPSLYPKDYANDRAPRIGLGCGKDKKPVLFWAEGEGKFCKDKNAESIGATLIDMCDIAEDLGLVNAINLDGGGSAQIILNGKRSLRISDRNKGDFSEAERAIPIALCVE